MNTTDATTIRFNRFEADRCRSLAKQAIDRGVRIIVVRGTDEHVAVEPDSPIGHHVTTRSCSCDWFRTWRRCDHNALLRSELGLDPTPEEIGWPEDHAVRREALEPLVWDMRPTAMVAD